MNERYRNGQRFTVLTTDRGNLYTPLVTRDDNWVVTYHRPDGSAASGYSPHHRDIVATSALRPNYRVEGYK